jgi:uncharacterized membrane protein
MQQIRAKKQYSKIYVVSEGQIIEPLTTVVGQVMSYRNISVEYILKHHHYPFKFTTEFMLVIIITWKVL